MPNASGMTHCYRGAVGSRPPLHSTQSGHSGRLKEGEQAVVAAEADSLAALVRLKPGQCCLLEYEVRRADRSVSHSAITEQRQIAT